MAYSHFEMLSGSDQTKMMPKCTSLVTTVVFATVSFMPVALPLCAQRAIKPATPAATEWKTRIPEIERVLAGNPLYFCPIPNARAQIIDAFGTAGDQLSVALVDWCPGGAYTDWIVAMRLNEGRPIAAQFRDAKGKPVPNSFAQGSSVMNSVGVRLVADQKAIYDFFSENNQEGELSHCGLKAYVWNSKTKTFDQNVSLSKSGTIRYCAKLRSEGDR